MTTVENSLIILGMFIVTFGIRFVLFARAHKVNMPVWLEHALQFVPVAVLSAIIVPMIIMPGKELTVSVTNPWLVGSLVAFIFGVWQQHQLVTIVVGVATFFLARFYIS